MSTSTVQFLLTLAVTVVVLFLFLGVTWAGLGGILFIIGWTYTRNHNLKFYLTMVACLVAFYLCARAGYGWIGAIAVVVLFNFSKVLRMYDNAKPDELPDAKTEKQQTELPFRNENHANSSE
jgi:hypothetical protein